VLGRDVTFCLLVSHSWCSEVLKSFETSVTVYVVMTSHPTRLLSVHHHDNFISYIVDCTYLYILFMLQIFVAHKFPFIICTVLIINTENENSSLTPWRWNSFLAFQVSHLTLQTLKLHYHIHNTPPVILILSHNHSGYPLQLFEYYPSILVHSFVFKVVYFLPVSSPNPVRISK